MQHSNTNVLVHAYVGSVTVTNQDIIIDTKHASGIYSRALFFSPQSRWIIYKLLQRNLLRAKHRDAFEFAHSRHHSRLRWLYKSVWLLMQKWFLCSVCSPVWYVLVSCIFWHTIVNAFTAGVRATKGALEDFQEMRRMAATRSAGWRPRCSCTPPISSIWIRYWYKLNIITLTHSCTHTFAHVRTHTNTRTHAHAHTWPCTNTYAATVPQKAQTFLTDSTKHNETAPAQCGFLFARVRIMANNIFFMSTVLGIATADESRVWLSGSY